MGRLPSACTLSTSVFHATGSVAIAQECSLQHCTGVSLLVSTIFAWLENHFCASPISSSDYGLWSFLVFMSCLAPFLWASCAAKHVAINPSETKAAQLLVRGLIEPSKAVSLLRLPKQASTLFLTQNIGAPVLIRTNFAFFASIWHVSFPHLYLIFPKKYIFQFSKNWSVLKEVNYLAKMS